MTKRPLCFLCFLMVLGLGIMNFAGIPLLGGNPLPVTVQDWIEAHPGSVICGEVEQYENTEFSQSVYLKKTYLIYQSKKFSIENVRVFLKKEEDLKPGMKILVKGTLKRVEEPSNPGGFDSQHYYACRHIYYFMKKAVVRKKTESYSGYRQQLFKVKEKCRQILTESAGEDAPLFCAMVLGDKQDLDPRGITKYLEKLCQIVKLCFIRHGLIDNLYQIFMNLTGVTAQISFFQIDFCHFVSSSFYRFFTNRARIAFRTARIITPTSAKIAIHMLAIPMAPRSRNNTLIPIAK